MLHRPSSSAFDNFPGARTPRSEKPGRSSLHQSFTFETPSYSARGPSLRERKRAHTFDPSSSFDGEQQDASVSKGGHSLRKRARIDYAQVENEDLYDIRNPDNLAKANPFASSSSLSARGRKRRSTADTHGDESDDQAMPSNVAGLKKPRMPRAHHNDAVSPVAARRKQTQELDDSAHHMDEDSDNDVKDTIEVGVTMSDTEEYSEEHSSYHDDESMAPHSSDGVDEYQPAERETPIAYTMAQAQEPHIGNGTGESPISEEPSFKNEEADEQASSHLPVYHIGTGSYSTTGNALTFSVQISPKSGVEHPEQQKISDNSQPVASKYTTTTTSKQDTQDPAIFTASGAEMESATTPKAESTVTTFTQDISIQSHSIDTAMDLTEHPKVCTNVKVLHLMGWLLTYGIRRSGQRWLALPPLVTRRLMFVASLS